MKHRVPPLAIVTMLLATQAALALSNTWDGPSGPTGFYEQNPPGVVGFYNSTTRTLVAVPSPPTWVQEFETFFAENGTATDTIDFPDANPNMTTRNISIPCDAADGAPSGSTTFCVYFRVRSAQNLNVRGKFTWTVTYNGGTESHDSGWQTIDVSAGRPVVSGGDRFVPQATVGTSCSVHTLMQYQTIDRITSQTSTLWHDAFLPGGSSYQCD